MKYMLLIHSDESRYPKMSEEDIGQLMAQRTVLTPAWHVHAAVTARISNPSLPDPQR